MFRFVIAAETVRIGMVVPVNISLTVMIADQADPMPIMAACRSATKMTATIRNQGGNMSAISEYDYRYVQRNASQLDPDWLDFDDMGPAFRIEVQAACGMATHHSRCRIRSDAYDYKRIDAWMREHRITNETMVIIFDMTYHRLLSVGTISNIRSGHYTHSKTVDEVMAIVDGCDKNDRR